MCECSNLAIGTNFFPPPRPRSSKQISPSNPLHYRAYFLISMEMTKTLYNRMLIIFNIIFFSIHLRGIQKIRLSGKGLKFFSLQLTHCVSAIDAHSVFLTLQIIHFFYKTDLLDITRSGKCTKTYNVWNGKTKNKSTTTFLYE